MSKNQPISTKAFNFKSELVDGCNSRNMPPGPKRRCSEFIAPMPHPTLQRLGSMNGDDGRIGSPSPSPERENNGIKRAAPQNSQALRMNKVPTQVSVLSFGTHNVLNPEPSNSLLDEGFQLEQDIRLDTLESEDTTTQNGKAFRAFTGVSPSRKEKILD